MNKQLEELLSKINKAVDYSPQAIEQLLEWWTIMYSLGLLAGIGLIITAFWIRKLGKEEYDDIDGLTFFGKSLHFPTGVFSWFIFIFGTVLVVTMVVKLFAIMYYPEAYLINTYIK